MAVVVQTDYAWPDDSVERGVIEAAGHRLVTGDAVPAGAEAIEDLIEAHDPEAILTCWAQVSAKAIAGPSRLQIVQRIGVGLDNIAVEAATGRGAWVANVPDYCVGEVSSHAIGLLLAWARGITAFDQYVKAGNWNPAGAELRRVSDLTVGIVGFGRIGRTTAAGLRGLGCKVIHTSRSPTADAGALSLNDLLAASEVVILHAPLTPDTHHLINAATIRQMRKGAYLINVSRGPLVDTAALLTALETGHLSGAGLDVVEGEPAPPVHLVSRSDVTITPHIAFSSGASLAELRRRSAEEVVRVLAGQRPHHPCNQPRASH